ncbi:MAG TPA: hypothetical protein VKQ72_18630 [Aggregatilineales bacterium]|nr:hypothetical protein [Aggregatilineales bacterium]
MILYRPVGLEEMRLVYQSELRAFPPRLPEQPIFYPVLTIAYARQIARDWNTKTGTQAGYVTRFNVKDSYISQFERHIVGGRIHEELWVPAGQLDDFNANIVGVIAVIEAYFGKDFRGYMPPDGPWGKKDAVAQFIELAISLDYNGQDFHGAMTWHRDAVFLNYSFWATHDFSENDIGLSARNRVLDAIQFMWSGAFPTIQLPEIEQR